MSIGRIDGFLDVFIEKDIEAGKITEAEAQELIDDLYVCPAHLAKNIDLLTLLLYYSLHETVCTPLRINYSSYTSITCR